MSRITYPRTSPYANTPQSSTAIGKYRHRAIPPHGQDQIIVLDVKYEYRPDKLAYDLYGSASLWWVFMVRNMNVIRDPINDFVTGIVIYVPSQGHLNSALGI